MRDPELFKQANEEAAPEEPEYDWIISSAGAPPEEQKFLTCSKGKVFSTMCASEGEADILRQGTYRDLSGRQVPGHVVDKTPGIYILTELPPESQAFGMVCGNFSLLCAYCSFRTLIIKLRRI